MTKSEHRVRVDNGKYEFICCEDGTIDAIRHGEPWLQRCMPQNWIHSLMCELDAARVVVQAVRKLTRGSDQLHQLPVAINRLAEALALHDSLVSDREPPSAWCGVGRVTQAAPTAAESAALPASPALGLLDLVYDIASDILADREPRWTQTQHRDNCQLLAKRVAAEVGALQRGLDCEANLQRNREIIRAWRGIDVASTIDELEKLWTVLDIGLDPIDRDDARYRYEERKAWILAHGEP